MAKLSSLIVDLQANNAQLKRALDEVQKKVGGLEKKINDVSKTFSIAFSASVLKDAITAMASFVQHGSKAADRMGKMAQAAGMTAEEFSRLNYAATLAGVPTDALGAAMSRLNRTLAEAALGGKQQSAVFKALGVAIKDGSGELRSADVVMKDLADRFSKMQDGAAKAALAQELFGKSGAQLIPLLNTGREGLAAAAAEADKFGITVSTSGAAAAEQFNDNLTRLQKAGEGVAVRVAQQLAPSLANLTDQLLNSKAGADALTMAADGLAAVMRVLATIATIVAAAFNVVGTLIASNFSAMYSAITEMANAFSNFWDKLKSGDVRGAFKSISAGVVMATDKWKETLSGTAEEIVSSVANAADRVKAIWSTTTEATGESDKKKVRKSARAAFDEFQRIAGAERKKVKDSFLEAAKEYEDFLMKIGSIRGVGKTRVGFGGFDLTVARPQKKIDMSGPTLADRMRNEPVGRAVLHAGDVLAGTMLGIGHGLAVAGQSVIGSLGPLGSAISGAVSRIAEGDVFGAIGEFLGNIITSLEGFQPLVDIMSGILTSLAPVVDVLLMALRPLLGAVGVLLEIVLNALMPAFEGLAPALEALAPILIVVAQITVAVIVPVAKLLGETFKLLAVAFQFIFDGLKYAALAVMMVVEGLFNIWNGIINAIRGLLYSIGRALAGGPLDFLSDMFYSAGNALGYLTIGTKGLSEQIDTLKKSTFESAKADATASSAAYEKAGADKRAAEAANKVTEALNNIPRWFKVAAARFNAVAEQNSSLGNLNVFIGGRQIAAVIADEWRIQQWRNTGR